MAKKGAGKRQNLLKNVDVKRWYDNMARGSRGTADNYVRVLGRFLDSLNMTPIDFIKLKPKQRDDMLSDYITNLLDAGKAGSYVAVTKKATVSWLSWNGKFLTRKIRVGGTTLRPKLDGMHIPSQDELRKVLTVADVRARTAIAFIAYSGVRPGVLGNYLGTDGLKVSNLPEAKIENNKLEFTSVPTKVVVPEKLSKTGRPYFTFIGAEGCAYLMAYFEERAMGGEVFTQNSPIITAKKLALSKSKPFVRALNLGDLIRKPMRAAGLNEPPYIWRSYFDSRAMLAESKGLLRDYRQFFMGHKGDIEHVYALHKTVPQDTVEAMRRAYESSLEYLETTPRGPREDPTIKMVSFMLQAAGYSPDEIEGMNIGEMNQEQIVEILRSGPKIDGNGKANQKIVTIRELPKVLEEGWEFKANLPDGTIIVQNPKVIGTGMNVKKKGK